MIGDTAGRSALLFSGGLDSVCFNHLAKPDLLIYAPTSSMYEAQEDDCVVRLRQDFKIVNLFTIRGVLELSRFERPDYIVPNRNAHLILLASHFATEIMLASVEGDRSTDKDDKFFKLMEDLLNHMWQEQHWTRGKVFTIGSPYKSLTKTELVRKYLDAEGSPEMLLESYSCYRGEEQHCGNCKPCFRKWVALENNGYLPSQLNDYFEHKFWEKDWFQRLVPSIKEGSYRGREDADVVKFLSWRHLI